RTLVDRLFWLGIPKEILSDKGSAFTSKLFAELAKCYGIKQLLTTAHHQQANGLVERANRTLSSMLSKTVAQHGGDWESHLGSALLCFNATPRSSTNCSPSRATYGHEPNWPSETVLSTQPSPHTWAMEAWIDTLPHTLAEIWQGVTKNSQKAQKQQAYQYDKSRKKTLPFRTGDRVWLFHPEAKREEGKLALPYYGPYNVLSISEQGRAKIRLVGPGEIKPIEVNVDRLSRCSELIPNEPADLRFPIERENGERLQNVSENQKVVQMNTMISACYIPLSEQKGNVREKSLENSPLKHKTSLLQMSEFQKRNRNWNFGRANSNYQFPLKLNQNWHSYSRIGPQGNPFFLEFSNRYSQISGVDLCRRLPLRIEPPHSWFNRNSSLPCQNTRVWYNSNLRTWPLPDERANPEQNIVSTLGEESSLRNMR
ncbi:MAG: transposase family protein, partial [Gammaproteobacteria bacterium]|nr:transposase family protein [Gammaproteobacteria bacterium]